MAAQESAARILELGDYAVAGPRAWHRSSTVHGASTVNSIADTLIRALDTLDQNIGLGDCTGRLQHATRGLAQLVSDDAVCAEVSQFVRCVWAMATATRVGPDSAPVEQRSVDLTAGTYRFAGTFVGTDVFGIGATVLVSVTPPTPDPLGEERLKERFGLTRAQVRVARLLALGLRNNEISGRLFLSSHTIRHHVEQIRDKVGGHTRAAVAARLRGEV